MNTDQLFKGIITENKANCIFSSDRACVFSGDSIEILKRIPDNSIALILTDPPYHTTKKKNIYGDTFFRADADYLEWIRLYSFEWRRILKPNGCQK